MKHLQWFVAVVVLLLAGSLGHAKGGQWEEINDEDGIKVFRKEVPGSDIVAFRGETVIDAPIQKVVWILADNEHRTEWVDRLYISTTLEKSSPYDYVLYQAFKLPVIISNRDYVYRGKLDMDADSGVVTLHMSSTEHPKAPETVGVRANLINSRYTLTPIEGGKMTWIEVEIHTDPKGLIPTWLVNLIQKSWPFKTLSGIRAQVEKPHVQEYVLPHPMPAAKTGG
jgi:hypothetical protein